MKLRPLARALCRFGDGPEERLHATDLSVDGAFLLALAPRPVGQVFSLVLQIPGSDPLPPVQARVVTCHLDPRAPEESGIEVLFAGMDEPTASALAAAIANTRRVRSVVPRVERRGAPRVRTSLLASLAVGGADQTVRIVDLSMTGAQLAVADPALLASASVGTEVTVTIADSSFPEVVTLRAQIVRFCRTGETFGVGARWLEVGAVERSRLEGMLLAALMME